MNRIPLLITGGMGFIGSNFISYLLQQNNNYYVINLDNLTYASDPLNLTDIEKNTNYHFIKGDIRNKNLVNDIINDYDIQGIIHFAAESHVDNSIRNPELFIETNILGTFHLLEAARKRWEGTQECRFLHVSTDEVYGSLGSEGVFTEESPYAPNSPYSASKASADMIVRSYYKTYGMNVIKTNCSNNYGPKQHNEKLIPTIIRKAINNEPIPIYGDGKNSRDWLYVVDHCKAIDMCFHKGTIGETYNIGGGQELTNIDLAIKICLQLNQVYPSQNLESYVNLITFVADRPGHDFRYAIDSSKISKELGWKPEENIDNGLRNTILWYLNKYCNNMGKE